MTFSHSSQAESVWLPLVEAISAKVVRMQVNERPHNLNSSPRDILVLPCYNPHYNPQYNRTRVLHFMSVSYVHPICAQSHRNDNTIKEETCER
jgi:hypothetical protein